MKMSLKIFSKTCFLVFCGICIILLLQKSYEINQANIIINDFKKPYTLSYKDYVKEVHSFTTVFHVKQPITPFVCERVIKARIKYPHLFYSNGQLMDTASQNACKGIKQLSVQFKKGNSFAHLLECIDNSQCECVYGFCENNSEEK